MKPRKSRGRPKKGLTQHINIVITLKQKKQIKAFAGKTLLSEAIRTLIDLGLQHAEAL